MRVAAVDLGTKSVRLLVVDSGRDGVVVGEHDLLDGLALRLLG
jgi:exopolyphosphatase/pppGpp-phosphohydrolase